MNENKNKKDRESQNEKDSFGKKWIKKWKSFDSGKKDKIFFGVALMVILLCSILTANVNLSDHLAAFFQNIWDKGQEAVEESEQIELLAKGAHVEIKSNQTNYLIEIYAVLGEEIEESQAVTILQEIKTLVYHGKKRGVAASSKEKNACINKIKKKLKDANESEYNSMVRRYGDEEDYWTILDSAIEEYVIAEKVKEEKRAELKEKKDVDVEKELQEYIDEIVSYENFQ